MSYGTIYYRSVLIVMFTPPYLVCLLSCLYHHTYCSISSVHKSHGQLSRSTSVASVSREGYSEVSCDNQIVYIQCLKNFAAHNFCS